MLAGFNKGSLLLRKKVQPCTGLKYKVESDIYHKRRMGIMR